MKPTVICLTPVRNEAWILERFLKAASLWADHIIIADQMSTDGSREIAMQFSKVILIDNESNDFNEPDRARLLINEARKIEGPRLLISLDADEMFTPNVINSTEWESILNSKPGTVFGFEWANIRPDLKTIWFGDIFFPWGFLDDGSEYLGFEKIHSGRIPNPIENLHLNINEIKVMHFQYVDWERMISKQCFYQCYETILYTDKSALEIFRKYHHMYSIDVTKILHMPDEWKEEYKKSGIDITSVCCERKNWYDLQILNYFQVFGTHKFKKIGIWNINWVEKAIAWEKPEPDIYKDPRSITDKLIQYWLLKTQDKLNKRKYRRIDRLIKFVYHY